MTGALYLWDLSASGWGNQFYAAAVQAASVSWKAMLFGSSDAANAITVDKTPGALWVMDLSVRLFGFHSWSVLAPQALEGVAAVGVLYVTVRRTAGHTAGLVAGAVLALTPVAALMFRYDNPDSLLALLLTIAAYGVLRAVEQDGAAWWLPVAGVAVGFGFLAKMTQAFLVLPAFAFVYLLAAQGSWRKKFAISVAAVATLVLSAGWYPVLVAWWPAGSRPYIGGSQHNSVLELALGYNGVGRLTGHETGGLGNTNAEAGWDRLFGREMGGGIAWLLPAAVILGGAGLWVLRRAPRTDTVRAGLLVWLGWLVVTGAVFSFADGIVHPYYTVALAPAIAGAVSIGASLMWQRRNDIRCTVLLTGTAAVTTALAVVLLHRTPYWNAWLIPLVIVTGIAAATAVLFTRRRSDPAATATALSAVVVSLIGPAAYSLATVAIPHGGALPSAGPSTGLHFPTGLGRSGTPEGPAGNSAAVQSVTPESRSASAQTSTAHGNGPVPGGRMTGLNAFGRLIEGTFSGAVSPGPELTQALDTDAGHYTWVAAIIGSNSAASYQLATRHPVLAVGGYNGTDPAPTLAWFQTAVAQHRIHYFLDEGMLRVMSAVGSAGSGQVTAIDAWVRGNFTATTLDGVTAYDLTEVR
ncbi:glycosyltransferase family 39 protein [Nocardia sp. CA2R105]|uniref:glycosyltransferase family 39 protein n=1 Tax=Nocardia coffeae TaxID=2873381 RepID=UPI001CA6C5AF|nr:glycosyltransferase family 39 protein [Nocardia coffeae]MBY8858006.1 glycosyltransferase family 39 protein [Nocardia coffeae]